MANLSTTSMLILAILLLSYAASVVVGGDPNDDSIKEACGMTPVPATCVAVLERNKHPDSALDDPRELANTAVYAAIPLLTNVSTAVGSQKESTSDADSRCFSDCNVEIEKAITALREANDGQGTLATVRSFLRKAKARKVEWNCQRCRQGDAKNKVDIISKDNEAEKFMEVLPVLLNRALDR